jgi:hypothetical protein
MATTILPEYGGQMSNYLDNLVAKNFNRADVIQPRPVSLFEPQPASVWPASDHHCDLEMAQHKQIANEPGFDNPPPPQRPPQTRLKPLMGVEPRQPDDVSPLLAPSLRQAAGNPLLPSVVPPQIDVKSQRPEANPIQPAAQQVSETPAQLETTEWSVKQSSSVATPQPVEAESLKRIYLPVSGSQQPSLAPPPLENRPEPLFSKRSELLSETGRNTVPKPGDIREEGKPVLKPLTRRAEVETTVTSTAPSGGENVPARTDLPPSAGQAGRAARESPVPPSEPAVSQPKPAPFVCQPQVKPYLESAPIASVETTPPLELDPTIQVTIGRIEVRATPPPRPVLPPKKEHPKSQLMGLDEYLRQRTNGGNP